MTTIMVRVFRVFRGQLFRGRLFTAVLLFALLMACGQSAPPTSAPNLLVLADFNSGTMPNNVGGPYGPFVPNEENPGVLCRVGYSTEHRRGLDGYALKLEYDVEDSQPAFSGFWMKLQNLDASAYDRVSIALKGDIAGGLPNHATRLKLELKSPTEAGQALVEGITSDWKVFTVPISEFKGLSDRSFLTEFVIVFDDRTVDRKTGIIYVEDIVLERSGR